MGGIGFQLNKLLNKGSYTSVFQAYGYATLVSSGPWVISIVSLALLGAWTGWGAGGLDGFFAAVMYIYGFSLILTGSVQLMVTRHAADMLYLKDRARIYPSFLTTLGVVMFVAAILGAVFFVGFTSGSILFRVMAAQLFAVVCGVWIAMVFVSALKDYRGILVAFAIGFGLSLVGGGAGFHLAGSDGVISGFLFGQMVLLMILVGLIRREFEGSAAMDFSWTTYFRKQWPLAVCGLFYNCGIWADKLIHWWFSPYRVQISGGIWASPLHDQPVYLSYLAIVPGIAVFYIALEARFAQKYEGFFHQVISKAPLSILRAGQDEMFAALRAGIALLIKVQGLVTVVLIMSAAPIGGWFGLNPIQISIFQVSLIGVFLLVLLMSFLIVLFYLDKTRDALFCCVIFAVVNSSVTFLSLAWGERYYGIGLAAGAMAATVVAALLANLRLRDLLYQTFALQRITS